MARFPNTGKVPAHVRQATEMVESIVPATSEAELDQIIERVPAQHRTVVHEAIRHASGHYERLFAAAAAAILVREEMQPNSAVTLWPATLAPGANATPGTVYPLVPFLGAAAQQPFNFVRGMRFFGILTGSTDSTAGWCVVANTLKLATDAISGIQYSDSTFALFQTDVVQGRMITAEYERHLFLEQVTFTASAVLRNAAPQPMLEGLTVQYWDDRCKDDVMNLNYFEMFTGEDFPSMVRDLIARANGGFASARLERLRMRR